jgi:hypothetical protein
MKKELVTCHAELVARGAPQHKATSQRLTELEQRFNDLVAHGITREAPRPDVTSQSFTERVKGIVADGAPGMWANMAHLAELVAFRSPM